MEKFVHALTIPAAVISVYAGINVLFFWLKCLVANRIVLIMIAYIKGKLAEVFGSSCLVLTTGGVGYELALPAQLLPLLPENWQRSGILYLSGSEGRRP